MFAKSSARAVGFALAAFSLGAIGQQQQEGMQQQQEQQQPGAVQQTQKSAAGQEAKKGGDKAPVVVLMPVAIYPRGEEIAKGCWVRLYEGNNFEGRQLTVIGPAELPNVEENVAVFGFDSAIVGPKAKVTTYDGENYEDRTATLEPGKKYPDLGDTKLGLFEDIESMHVKC